MTSRVGVVRAFLAKDLRIHARDRFYVVVTIIGLVFFIGIFWLLPDDVDETVHLGIHIEDAPERLLTKVVGDADGFELTVFDSSDALVAAVEEGDPVVAGVDLPAGFIQAVRAGEDVSVRVVLQAGAPDELHPALSGMVRELGFVLAGKEPPVTPPDMEEAVLGVDRAGAQLSIRDQLRPVFVVMALFVEMFALASLVAGEIQQRTITAVLATPARITDVLAAKTVVGMLLAFSQAAIILVATGAATRGPLLLAVALLLGAVLVAGVGMTAGSSGRDFIEVVFWSLLIGLPVMIPAFGALFPGSAPGWIQALPGHGLVQVIIGTTAYGDGWADAAPYLAMLTGWCVVVFALGTLLLQRRVARL